MKQRNAARRMSTDALHHTAIGTAREAIVTARPSGPRCPKCGLKTERRERRADGRAFWGCVRFPHCRGNVPIEAGSPEDTAAVDASTDPFERIGRKNHRAFAVQVAQRTRAGDTYDEIVLGAMRAVFPRSKRVSDEVMRERGRALALEPHILAAIHTLLDERP